MRGRNSSLESLRKWVSINWGTKLSSPPEVTKLMKDWFMFLLPSKKEAETLLTSTWEMAGVPIVLQRWSPIFDAAQAKAGKEPIWVKLLGLPFHP